MNWRELLEPQIKGRLPLDNIDTIDKKTASKGNNPISVNVVKVVNASSPIRPAPRMGANVRKEMAADSETMFIHLWRRLSNRLSRAMKPGYLLHAERHAPGLWARCEALRMAWDNSQAWIAFKTCAIPWVEYRGRIYQWARAELVCIRKHREETF